MTQNYFHLKNMRSQNTPLQGRVWLATDLDGTLLDHHTYSYKPALPALELCKEQGIPVVLSTSKTQAEVVELHAALELDAPIIVENGSALVWPDSRRETQVFGICRHDILEFIGSTRRRYGFDLRGFNDWSVSELRAQTGLSTEAAEKAACKQYSEPFVWHDSDTRFKTFCKLVEHAGLSILKGGRFYHLQGCTDKAKPLVWLRGNLNTLFTRKIAVSSDTKNTLICLGDNHNDIAMLNLADIAVLVKNPSSALPILNRTKPTLVTTEPGPLGWNLAVIDLLTEYN